MAGAIIVNRENWLGYRWHKQGLGGAATEQLLNDLLMLGIQDGRCADAVSSMLQRTDRIGSTSAQSAINPDGPLVSLWSARGAPHAHRADHLDFVRDAVGPRRGGDEATVGDPIGEVSAALSSIVTGPTLKSTASSRVAELVPAAVARCASCDADHVPDGTFRAAGRQAKIVLGPDENRATVLHPPPDCPQVEFESPILELLNTFFRVNGPMTRTLFRDWLEADTETITAVWDVLKDELVRVQVDDRRYVLPESQVTEVQSAPKPEGVALVPPHDPYLRQVDRQLLVPDRERRQQVWKALSGPGALLVDGEVEGTWRYRRREHAVTISTFGNSRPRLRKTVEKNAELVGEAFGDDKPTVHWA